MPGIDWSRFSHKIYINASVQRIYDAWTTRAKLESWFLRKAEFTTPEGAVRADDNPIQKDDTYEFRWHGHPDTVTHGTVTEANGHDRFQFVFGNEGIVTVSLREVENMTEMILTQHDIPTDEQSRFDYHVGCSTGWAFYEGNIKSILEGGLDLRNKNPGLKNSVDACRD